MDWGNLVKSELGLEIDAHKEIAAKLFNFTWELIDKRDRDRVENDMMVNAAHASRFHWSIAGSCLQLARGDWLISRVYSLLGRSEPALYYARTSLEFCINEDLGNFDLGFAYEAMARAFALQGNMEKRDEYMDLAMSAGSKVEDTKDRKWLIDNVNSVASLTLPVWDDTDKD